ncbi:MAG: hypothetical protein QXE15_06715, partial [Candidatus Bathyarchaeia archaeon]
PRLVKVRSFIVKIKKGDCLSKFNFDDFYLLLNNHFFFFFFSSFFSSDKIFAPTYYGSTIGIK